MELLKHGGQIESSNSQSTSVFWSKSLNLKLPNKVKNFVWRVCTNSRPTKLNFLQQVILLGGLCAGCDLEIEDSSHALFKCTMFWQ